MLRMILESAAPSKSISTPGRSQIVTTTIRVLIITVEIPMVKIASGRAMVLIRGLTKELTSEKISPATA